MQRLSSCRTLALLIVAVAVNIGLLPRRASAAIVSWDGTGTSWNVASSWSTDQSASTPDPAAPPGANDLADFNISTVNTPQTVNLNAAQAAAGLLVDSTGSVLIQSGSGTNTLSLGLGGIALVAPAGGLTITAPVSLVANQDWANDSANLLNVTNSISLGANTLTFAGQGNSTLNGTIGGSGGLTANPLATLVLNGANTYTGITNINAGTIVLGNASALGPVAGGTTISNDGTLDLAGQSVGAEPVGISGNGVGASGALINSSATAASLSGNITLAGNTTVGSGNITLSGAVTNGYSLTKIGSGTLTLSGTSDNVGLTATVNSGTLVLAKTSSGPPNHVHALGNTTALTVNGGTAQLAGTGNDQIWDSSNVMITSGTLDTNGKNETMNALYLQGTGIFGAGALINTVDVSIITPASGTVLTGNTTIGTPSLFSSLQLNNTISGNFAITKVGDGSLFLPGSNTFSGGLFIQSGQLQIASINNAGTNGPLGNNANVTLGSSGQTARLAYSGASASSNMPFILPSGAIGEFYISGAGVNLTLNGTISGAGTLRVPAGRVTLGASNAFTGGLKIDNGEVILANSGALNSSTPNAVTFTDSIGPISMGKLFLQDNVTLSGLSTNSFGSSVQDLVQGTGPTTLTVDNAADNSFSGILNFLSLTKTGGGTLTLGGTSDNIALGATVNGGKLVLAKTSSSTPNDVHAIGGNGLVVNGGTVQLAGTGGDQIYDGASVTINAGTFDMNGRNDTVFEFNLQGTGIASAGALVNSSANQSTLTGSFHLTTPASIGGSGNITLNGSVTDPFTGGVGSLLTKVGSNTLTLSGTTDNTNLHVAVNAGTLVLAKTNSGNGLAIGFGGLTVNGGTAQLAGTGDQIWDQTFVTVTSGTFDSNGRNETISSLNLQGTGIGSAGALVNTAAAASTITPTNGTTLTGNTTIGVTQSTGSLTLNKGIAGNFTLTKVGAGTLNLPGTGSVVGPINVNAGTLAQSGASFAANVTNSGNFIYNSGTFSGRLTNAGTATFNANFTAGNGMQNDLSVSIPAGRTIRFNGLGFANNGAVAISGGDTTIIGKVNNNSGGQILTAGGSTTTFFSDVVNNGSISTSAGARTTFVGIYSGAGTLTGAGTSEFALDVHPGNIPAGLGVLQAGGDAIFDDTAQADIQLGGTTPGTQYDQIHVTGQLTLVGSLNVALTGGFNPAAGNSFDILDWGTLTGTFNMLTLPALSSGLSWNTSQLYVNGTLSVSIAGDYNHNGVVDAADYVVWRKTLGQTGTGLAADGNGNGQIDSGDFDVWRAHFGQAPGSGAGASASAAVPEPSTLLLIVAAIGWCFWRGWSV